MARMGTLIILCSQEWRREEFRTVVRGREDRNRSEETKKKRREEKVGAGNKVRGEHSDKGGERWKGMKTEGGGGKKKNVLNRRFESKCKKNKRKRIRRRERKG